MTTPSAPTRRRPLQTGLASDEQAIRASQDLAMLQVNPHAVERLDLKASIKSLYPSPANPRRALANAGVTRELVEKIALKPHEDASAWRVRYTDYLRTLIDERRLEDEAVWSELFDLAESIRRSGLLQPIIAQPNGEIIAGERRWTACILAGITHERVIYRLVGDDQVHVFRLIENLQRANLTVAETAHGVRQVASKLSSSPLGPDNAEITLPVIMEILGCKKTVGAQYLALCRLPDGDPMLAQILSGGYGGIRAAYEAISVYKKSIAEQEQAANMLPGLGGRAEASSMPGSSAATPPPTRQPQQPKLPAARIKMPMPKAQTGARLLGALRTIDGLPSGIIGSIESAITGWSSASDAVRKKMLINTLEAVINTLDSTLEDEEPA